jgi:hypothetical protein
MPNNPLVKSRILLNPMNEKSFSHVSRWGTEFQSFRCDFRNGVAVKNAPKDKAKLASDVAEMIGYHSVAIWPNLNGFQGYDCIQWAFI